MNQKTNTTPAIIALFHQPQTVTGLPVVIKAGPLVTLPAHGRMPTIITPTPATRPLSELIEIGRHYHPLCRGAFVQKHIIGHYHYERRTQWYTCAVAAAYAGAFGPHSIERPEFSYSMALWRLSQKVGYDLNQRLVCGPTGRHQSVAEEMVQLVDQNLWNREGLVEWLRSVKL